MTKVIHAITWTTEINQSIINQFICRKEYTNK